MIKDTQILKLSLKAREIRKLTIRQIGNLGVGHIGGSMSIIELLTILYYRHMNVNPSDPKYINRDILILSKGHAGPALYSVLADKGFFPKDWIWTLNKGGTKLPSHCDMRLTPGVDMTTGSLGLGLSVAVGIALGHRLNKIDSKIFLILGDGENNEGQIWEGAMAASHFKLNNLIAFIDYNKMQVDGYLYEIMNIEDLEAKWLSFGWFVQRINGHNFLELDMAIKRGKKAKDRPSMIILDTIKGRGCCFAEGIVRSHSMKFSHEAEEEAIKWLDDNQV